MNILPIIAYHAGNATQCEALLDHLYQQHCKANGKKFGHLLLAHDAGVHAENRERCLISARLAFENVNSLEVRTLSDPSAPKFKRTNSAFRQVAESVESDFRWPFLWLEPDCTILRLNWLEELEADYAAQPRPFFGAQMKAMLKDNKELQFMARVGVYPNDTHTRLFAEPEMNGPFEIALASRIAPRMTATKDFQQLNIKGDEDLAKVRDNALLVHGDKSQILLKKTFIWKPEKQVISVLENTSAQAATIPIGTAAPQDVGNSSDIPPTPQAPKSEIPPIVVKTRRKRRTKLEMAAARNGAQ